MKKNNFENIALLTDMVAWLGKAPRKYSEVMEAWQTSCPRLSIWEDALQHKFVERYKKNNVPMIKLTKAGMKFLSSSGKHFADK